MKQNAFFLSIFFFTDNAVYVFLSTDKHMHNCQLCELCMDHSFPSSFTSSVGDELRIFVDFART